MKFASAVRLLQDAIDRRDVGRIMQLLRRGILLVARTIGYYSYLPLLYAVFGLDGVSHFVFLCGEPRLVLSMFGAQVGKNVRIGRYLIIHGAKDGFRNLRIGDNVHIGKNCFFDLSDSIAIEAHVTISMQCTLITHLDVGDIPLKQSYESVTAPVHVHSNSYLGAGVRVLHGVTIGEGCLVGAGAVVTKSVVPCSVVAGVPARHIRALSGQLSPEREDTT